MTTKLNKESYERLVKEDIKWLENSIHRTLERDHIIRILEDSVNQYYPSKD